MVSEPLLFIDQFVQIGSDYITIHIEAKDPVQAVKKIKASGG